MIVRVLSLSSLIVIIDRLTKYLAIINLSEGESIGIIPGFLHITLVFNSGAAFGLFKGRSIFFIISSVLVMGLICAYIWRGRCKDFSILVALSLILGGAAGNLIDRVSLGYVIDFLDFRVWPVFNIADTFVTIGALILTIRLISDKKCFTT